MRRFQSLFLGTVVVALSLALFFVGREAASWRPQRVSIGGLKAIHWHQNHEVAASRAALTRIKRRLKIDSSDIVAVSANGKWMARGSKVWGSRDDFLFEVQDAKTGMLRAKVDYDQGEPDEVGFSPTGRFLAIRFYNYITMVFDARTGQRLWYGNATQLLFSPDEKIVVRARQFSSRHGDGGIGFLASDAKTGTKIRVVLPKSPRILLPIWFDGPNHIQFGDSHDNLWRVKVR